MTEDCLATLAEHSPRGHIQVIAVDNGSTDATRHTLEPLGQALFGSSFSRLRFENNMGFARACNAGTNIAAADYVFFLNNDTLLRPGWLEPLLELFQYNPRIGAAAPLLLYPDRYMAAFPGGQSVDAPENYGLQHCGVAFSPDLSVKHIYNCFPANHSVGRKRRYLQAITGAAMMLPKALFRELGGFCEDFINGFEDIDLCLRLNQKGYSICCEPKSSIFHLESQTPGRNLHDCANAALANERIHPRPDMHKIIMEDGLRPALNHHLELYPLLDCGLEAGLDQSFRSSAFNADRCRKRLEEYPLWRKGYALLSEELEKQGNWEGSARLRLLQTRLMPEENLLGGLVTNLERVKDRILSEQLEKTILALGASIDPVYLKAKAEVLAAWSRSAGETVLERLYSDWVRDRFQPT